MTDLLREQIAQFQATILARFPETKFKLEPTEKDDIWHFSIFTPEGTIRLPSEITEGLNRIWREQKVSIITVVYPLSLYQEES